MIRVRTHDDEGPVRRVGRGTGTRPGGRAMARTWVKPSSSLMRPSASSSRDSKRTGRPSSEARSCRLTKARGASGCCLSRDRRARRSRNPPRPADSSLSPWLLTLGLSTDKQGGHRCGSCVPLLVARLAVERRGGMNVVDCNIDRSMSLRSSRRSTCGAANRKPCASYRLWLWEVPGITTM